MILLKYIISLEDKFGGYQRENRSFFVEVSEIVRIISEPVVKQISVSHHTMMFKDLHE